MRIMTLNIRYGSGIENLEAPGYDQASSPEKLLSIAAAVRSVKPDIVALQEVRNQRQVENLARLTEMNSIYVSHPIGYRLFFFEWGLAFLHRPRLVETTKRTMLIDHPTGVGRNGLVCRLMVDETVVTFINVHFDHIGKATQIDNALRLLESSEPPVCLLGDFNCDSDDPLLVPLRSVLSDTCLLADTALSGEALVRGTMLTTDRRRDYIWVDPHTFSVQEAGLLAKPHRTISDHIGYYADVILK
jgi:endonuclease/exonuclease/phosphatase family metal-dependent hydrolase